MRSRWAGLKWEALRMRRRGHSIRDVEKSLGIPRSTLSWWFRKVVISEYYRARLKIRHERALVNARKGAVKWHNAQKASRIASAIHEGDLTLQHIDSRKRELLELALSMLYLGEGAKTNERTAMGNSNPLILKFFVKTLRELYEVPPEAFKCHLHLRADQDPQEMKQYWSRILNIPEKNFGKALIDKRTIGSPTYHHYKGVCAIHCSRVAIQRKLMYIGTTFCQRVTEEPKK